MVVAAAEGSWMGPCYLGVHGQGPTLGGEIAPSRPIFPNTCPMEFNINTSVQTVG